MTHNTKTLLGILLGVVVVFGGLMWMLKTLARDEQAQRQARKEVVCPSFLSIARSARDTLIIMRNEPLCNRYVLDNLK